MRPFDAVTTWEPTGVPDTFSGHVPAVWMQGRAAFGGLLAAGAVRLAQDAFSDRVVSSVDGRFFEPVARGDFQVRREVLRVGRSLAHIQIEVWQAEKRCFRAVVCMSAARPSDLVVPAPQAPDDLDVEGTRAMPYFEGLSPVFTQNVDCRFASGLPYSGGKFAEIDGWCRFRDGSTGLAGAIGLIDVWPAPLLHLATAPFPASTVHWTTHVIHGDAVDDPDALYRYRARTVAASGGMGTCIAWLWAPDGRLVSWSEQLVAVFDRR